VIEDIEQGSEAWFSARLGKVTASRVADVIAKTKMGWGTSRANYMAELVAERLTGQPAERFSNAAMAWGTEQEPNARLAYEFETDQEVSQVGFVPHPLIAMSGASPDGRVGEHGLVEIKCPSTSTHIETLLSQAIPGKYATQMMWQMACDGRDWCDFVSFDPRLPENMRLFISRVKRDHAMIADLERDVTGFIAELDEKVSALIARYGVPAGLIAEAA
jgi:putative phage-type endonuclease